MRILAKNKIRAILRSLRIGLFKGVEVSKNFFLTGGKIFL